MSRTPSFYASPAEAAQAPPDDLYVAYLHEGTGTNKPDFLAAWAAIAYTAARLVAWLRRR